MMVNDRERILITGGTGLLGRSLVEIFKKQYDVVATYIGNYHIDDETHVNYIKLDIQDFDGYERLFRRTTPSAVIHTAGIGSPDYAESNKEKTYLINISSTKSILSQCKEYDSKFIYISSNGIYDGDHAPYSEDDEAKPVNFYGDIKLEGERVTMSAGVVFAIVRPHIMYGWHHPFERSNIITLALDKLARGDNFMAYDNTYVMPLYVEECARAIFKIFVEEKYDIFNIAGRDRVSIYELIRRAANVFQLNPDRVFPVGQSHFGGMVARPRDTSFRTEKMQNILAIRPLGIEEGLSLMKQSGDLPISRKTDITDGKKESIAVK